MKVWFAEKTCTAMAVQAVVGATALYLPENLGFIVHPKRIVTVPTEEIEFLGMQVDPHMLR